MTNPTIIWGAISYYLIYKDLIGLFSKNGQT